MFVLADSDWLADEAIRCRGNQRAGAGRDPLADGRRGVLRRQTSTEADVPITHTRKQDVVWFYSTIFLAPGAGDRRPASLVTRKPGASAARQKRGGRAGAASPPPPARKEVRHDRPRAQRCKAGWRSSGLLAAHCTWQREPERAPGAVTVIDASKIGRHPVHYEDESQQPSTSTRGRPATRTGVWLHLVTKPKTPRRSRTQARRRPPSPSRPSRSRRRRRRAICRAPSSAKQALRSVRAARLAARLRRARRRQAEGAGPRQPEAQARRDREGRRSATTRSDSRRTRPAARRSCATPRDGRVYLMPRGMLSRAAERPATWSIAACTRFELGDFDRIMLSVGRQVEGVRPGRPRGARPRPASRRPRRPTSAIRWPRTGTTPLWRIVPDRDPRQGRGAGRRQADARCCGSTTRAGQGASAGSRSGACEPSSGVADDGGHGDIYARTEHTAGWVKIPSGGQIVPDAQKLIAAP